MNYDQNESSLCTDQKSSLLKDGSTVTIHPNAMKRPTKKVMLLGFNNVGKSSLANKFVFDYFQENNHNSAIEENFKKTVKLFFFKKTIPNQKILILSHRFKKETIDLVIIDSPSLVKCQK